MNSQTKERPITFNAEMVRAILSGTKTQTRRSLKPQPDTVQHGIVGPLNGAGNLLVCRKGERGELLWVQEDYCWSGYASHPDEILYRSGKEYSEEDRGEEPWREAKQMPRWASRITLEITNLRVERIQEISEQDAWAEGCLGFDDDVTGGQTGYGEFGELWDSIYKNWKENPWVWVIEFKVIKSE